MEEFLPAEAIHSESALEHVLSSSTFPVYVWVQEWPNESAALDLRLESGDSESILEPWSAATILRPGERLRMRAAEEFLVHLACDDDCFVCCQGVGLRSIC